MTALRADEENETCTSSEYKNKAQSEGKSKMGRTLASSESEGMLKTEVRTSLFRFGSKEFESPEKF